MIIKNDFVIIGRNRQRSHQNILLDTGAPSCLITKSLASTLNQFEDSDPEGMLHRTRTIKDLIGNEFTTIGCCRFEILLKDNNVASVILDIIPDWCDFGDRQDRDFNILLGTDFFEANHINLDFHQYFPPTEDYIPDGYSIYATVNRPNEEPIQFAYATEIATKPSPKPTIPWWKRIDDLIIEGPKGKVTCRCAINPAVSNAVIVKKVADQLIDYIPIPNDTLEFEWNQATKWEGITRLTAQLNEGKMSFSCDIVESLPHDVEVIFGYPEISIWGLKMKAGKFMITYPDPIINI